jgi:hypothetical protein
MFPVCRVASRRFDFDEHVARAVLGQRFLSYDRNARFLYNDSALSGREGGHGAERC